MHRESAFHSKSVPSTQSVVRPFGNLGLFQIQGFPAFPSDHLPLELMPVRLGPGEFEFEMRFRSVWVQRLPFFVQVIAIFKKQLETIDVFRSFFPVSLFGVRHYDLVSFERDRDWLR